MKPHWFSVYSSVCSWNSAVQRLRRRGSSQNPSAPLGAAVFWRRRCPWSKQGAGVDVCLLVRACAYVYVCMHTGFICLAPHVKGNDSCYSEGQETTRYKLETTCWAGEQGAGKCLFLTSILALIHYRLYMSKRLPSVNSVERACDAFVRPLSPKGSAALPSFAANAKHCYLEWCISLCLPAAVDSPSPTQTEKSRTPTGKSHTHAHKCMETHGW